MYEMESHKLPWFQTTNQHSLTIVISTINHRIQPFIGSSHHQPDILYHMGTLRKHGDTWKRCKTSHGFRFCGLVHTNRFFRGTR